MKPERQTLGGPMTTPERSAATTPDKVIIQEVFVRKPAGWFRKVGNMPWQSVSLEPFNGMLPVVWLSVLQRKPNGGLE